MRDKAALMQRMLSSGVYLVTDRALATGRSEEEIVGAAIGGGVGAVQLRLKQESRRTAYDVALRLTASCRAAGVPLFINDDLGLALAVDADGVHVGQEDLPARVVRSLLGPNRLLGVTAAAPDLARTAQQDGADYVGVGAMFPTTTKEATLDTGLAGLRRVRVVVDIPIVAIGGIDVQNAARVVEAGGDAIAVVRAIVAAPDVETATAALVQAVAAARSSSRR
jgi:thiamine-phosphate pyrophosphorylase